MTTLFHYIYMFWGTFDDIIIKGLSVSVLLLIFSKTIFKGLNISISLFVIKFILMILCLCSILFLVNYLLQEESDGTPLISNIEYNPAYQAIQWMSNCFRIILPLTIFITKIRRNLFYLLLVSILINLYWIFDLMILEFIQPENLRFFPRHNPRLYLVSGVMFGVLLVIISFIYTKFKLIKSK